MPARTRRRATGSSPFEAVYGFSRAIRVDNRIFVAGTAPIEADGSSTPGDAAAQARRCFAIILDAIAELGGVPADVVRTRMFITDAADADAMEQSMATCFATSAQPRQWSLSPRYSAPNGASKSRPRR